MRCPPRDVALALGLGAGGYALQAGCYFAALERIDASLLSLLVYTFPAIVAVAPCRARARAADRGGGAVALVVASGGLALVVAGAGAGALDPLGAALGLTAAVIYAATSSSATGSRSACRAAGRWRRSCARARRSR